LHGQLPQHLRSLQPKGDPPTPREHGEIMLRRSWVGRNGILENKSGTISETRENGGKVTMDGLTNVLSNGTIPVDSPDPLWLPFIQIGGLQLRYPLLSQEKVRLGTSNLAGAFTGPIRIKAR